ncbi:hypothetical protein ONZ45_g87 [Pleurotus djamor]|nr:hypothetical protein ONZ45_g87 [Pleurotus djamor]
MSGLVLVSTHLSSVSPSSNATTLQIQTSRNKTPLPPAPKESDPPPEHASYASVLRTDATGTLLLRVLHGDLIVELVSLTTDIAPIRFVFPSPILPHPAIFVWNANQLHLLAVTTSGSFYRVVLSLEDSTNLWKHHIDRFTYHEYEIETIQGEIQGVAQMQSPHSVAIGLQNGSVLRIEATESVVSSPTEDSWSETVFQHGSFLTTITSFLHSTSSQAAEIISIASHPWPSDLGHVWTLSRDRTLRLWKAKIGCVTSKSLMPTGDLPAASSPLLPSFLDTPNQRLLHVFSSDDDTVYVIVYLPTLATSSGGSFRLFRTSHDQLHDEGTIECSPNSAHCHLQDFRVIGSSLCVLWDRQGQSMAERSTINLDESTNGQPIHPQWYTATYAHEPELTPAYLEELLLSPGSLTEKFFEAIMRPGTFSPLTLRTAIDQYTTACLSLPGPTPPQLTTSYATLGEQITAVVGCTVNLVRDPKSGTLQHGNYWNALKRDWEGFIARCREVERSARWPLVLGEHDKGEIIIVERERVGLMTQEDLSLSLRRTLSEGKRLEGAHHVLLDLLWTIWAKLDPQSRLNLESWIVDSIQQENAFAWADLIQDQVERGSFVDDLDEGFNSWVFGRLQAVQDFTTAVRTVLDVVSEFDAAVKPEMEDESIPLYRPYSDWSTALMAEYTRTTVQARYEFCLSLISLLFLLADDLSQWDPSLLAEIFAVFRGIAMLRYVSRQPAAEPIPVKHTEDATGADEVIARMREMQVSRSRALVHPTRSLVHRLIAQDSKGSDIRPAVHRFCTELGLFEASSTSHATKFDVLLCERLRLLKCYTVAHDILSWLPRTPGIVYVLSRLFLDMGRADDASYLLEKIAGCFGPQSGVSLEDVDSLREVLPNGDLFDSDHTFYCHAASLFSEHSFVQSEVLFTKLALSTAPSNMDTSALWLTVMKGYVDLRLYDDAYGALMACPYEKLNRDCVTQLIYRMCEDDAIDKLVTLNFGILADEVEDALSFKARNVDPRVRPYYSKILYTWYVSRGDYRNAASSMYLRARKLHAALSDPAIFGAFALEQLEAYSVAINALSLVDPNSTWISLPVQADSPTDGQSRKRRRIIKHIPDDKFTIGTYDVEIVDIKDIQHDHALLSAQLDVIRQDPSLLSAGEFLLPPPAIVTRMAQANQFNTALATARSLDVDMSDLFSSLTRQCIRLDRRPESVLQEDTTDWLLTDHVSSWTGSPAERGWRHLRQSLERHDSADTDFKYSKVVLETVLSYDKASSAPPWLIRSLEDNCHEHLIRTYLRFENIGDAVQSALTLILKVDSRLGRESKLQASMSWLPYSLIDQVVAAAESQLRTLPKLAELKTATASRVQRMQRMSKLS